MQRRLRPEEQDDLLRPRLIDLDRSEAPAGKVGGFNRSKGVRSGVGWVLPVRQRTARDGAAARGGAAVSAAHLPAVGCR